MKLASLHRQCDVQILALAQKHCWSSRKTGQRICCKLRRSEGTIHKCMKLLLRTCYERNSMHLHQ